MRGSRSSSFARDLGRMHVAHAVHQARGLFGDRRGDVRIRVAGVGDAERRGEIEVAVAVDVDRPSRRWPIPKKPGNSGERYVTLRDSRSAQHGARVRVRGPGTGPLSSSSSSLTSRRLSSVRTRRSADARRDSRRAAATAVRRTRRFARRRPRNGHLARCRRACRQPRSPRAGCGARSKYARGFGGCVDAGTASARGRNAGGSDAGGSSTARYDASASE